MSDVKYSWQKANQQYEAAKHFLNVTFPSLQDPKLFIAIINNIFSSLEAGIETILAHEHQQGLVPKIEGEFSEKLQLFRNNSLERNNIAHDYLHLMVDLKKVIEAHKKSPIEFRRKGAFVICDEGYESRSLTITDIKAHLAKAEDFLNVVEAITTETNK